MLGVGQGEGLTPRQRHSHHSGWTFGFQARLWVAALLVVTMTAGAMASGEPTVEELKAKLASANVPDRPRLCVQIAQRQLVATDQLYAAGEVQKAQATLTDVVAFSELARDYAIQSHKYQKQSEIAVRTMARKLADIKHLVTHEDQAPIQEAMNRLQRVRDDLLIAMFPKGAK
jgi:hypothetical protein